MHLWGSTHLQFSSGTVHKNLDHRPEKSKCLVALSLRPIWFFLLRIYLWLCGKSFSTCFTILPAKYVQVLQEPVSSSVCFVSTCVLLVDFCSSIRIFSHRSRVQRVTCFHQCSINHRWLPREVHQCSILFPSRPQCNSEVSENRHSEHRVSFLEQHDSDICNHPRYCRIVEPQHLDLDLGLLGFFLKNFTEILSPEVASRLVHSGG